MKRLALALGAATVLALAPVAETAPGFSGEAYAQSRSRGKKEAAPTTGGDPVKGMAEAPALVSAIGLKCSISGASLLGTTKTGEKFYEVSCSDGPGYMLLANADGTLKEGYECLQLKDGNAPQQCVLPGNTDPVAALARLAGPLVPGCTVDQARYMGTSPSTKQNNYEIGCANSSGAIIRVALPGASVAPETIRCETLSADGPTQCQFTTAEEKMAPLRALVAQSDKRACQTSDSRYVGASGATKETYYEVKCADGAGFMLVTNATGGFARTVECSRAQNIAGGCTLTDAVEAQQAEAGVYKQLAVKAGFDCDVDKYRVLGVESAGQKREVVELACKNKPEGAIAFFPASATGKTEIYDCTKNWRHKQSCSLTKLENVKPRLSRDLQTHGKSCDITNFRGAGMTSKGKTEFVEVACAGGQGLMIEYPAEGAQLFAPATGVFTCAEAKNIGEGCKLPTARS
jgi:hypothetical protein